MNYDLEWLETNGTGGFACGTLRGELQRKWHGLLWSARKPPRKRIRLVAGIIESMPGPGRHLGAHWEAGAWQQPSFAHVYTAFPFPQWEWSLPGANGPVRIRKRLVMPHGSRGIVLVEYLANASIQLDLSLILPTAEAGFQLYDIEDGEARAISLPESRPLGAVLLARERDCEDDPTEELHEVGPLPCQLDPDEPLLLAFVAEGCHDELKLAASADWFHKEEARRSRLEVAVRGAAPAGTGLALGLAADQFFARTTQRETTILAGYPWFTDWGRDAMIAIPGLCLATGRIAEAREILRHFLRHQDRGLIPNLFPEVGQDPHYNTVDATLWLVEMAFRCWTLRELLAEKAILTGLRAIILNYCNGTHHGIRMDNDGLIIAGAAGAQLTWMDVKVNGEVPTPRHGKPIEIQALWFNALTLMAQLEHEDGKATHGQQLSVLAQQVARSVSERFFQAEYEWPADVIDRDAPGHQDFAFRPNAVLAFALAHNVFDPAVRPRILDAVAQILLTPRGLRTLAPLHPMYRKIYKGNVLQRDRAYHQGTVWMWPLAAWVRGVIAERASLPKLHASLPALRSELLHHFTAEGCIHQFSEIFDADAPHLPRGCFAQAWSTAALIEIMTMDLRG